MVQGTIARITDKGFGFISREGEEKDVFFHTNECADFDSLKEGQAVSFDLEEGPKGLNAVNVTAA